MADREIKGFVEKNERLVSKKTGNPYWAIHMCGTDFNVFEDMADIFVVGKAVAVGLNRKGQYWNVETVSPIDPGDVPASAPAATGSRSEGFDPNEGVRRGACGHYASVLVAAMIRAGHFGELGGVDMSPKVVQMTLKIQDELYKGQV